MPKIPIIEKQSQPYVPKNKELSTEQPRYRNTGKPPLQLEKSYSPQAKRQKENVDKRENFKFKVNP
jgi:hypothetical protein